MDKGSNSIEITYTLVSSGSVKITVPKQVAAYLKSEEKRERTQSRDDRRFLADAAYTDGETELQMQQFNTVLGEVLENERNAALRDAIATLTGAQRRIVWAYYFRGYTMREIAGREGTNKATVCKTLKRARKRLKKILERGQLFSDGQLFDVFCPI